MQPLTRLFVIPPLLRRLLLLLLLLLQLQLQLSSKMILASPLESSSAFINRQYLFRLASSATTANGSLPDTMIRQVQTFIHQHTGLSVDISTISQIRTAFHGLLVQTNIPLPLDSIVSALQLQLPFIESIERDHKWSSTQVQSGLSGLGWGLDRIDQASNQLDGNYKFDSAGKGVNIYVVDSGIDADHPEFDGRAKSVYNSPRFTDGIDCQSHGTHVAGIAGGTNVGVAKLANLNAVRVVDCNGVTSTMEIVAALDWILANHKKPAVVSMSLVSLMMMIIKLLKHTIMFRVPICKQTVNTPDPQLWIKQFAPWSMPESLSWWRLGTITPILVNLLRRVVTECWLWPLAILPIDGLHSQITAIVSRYSLQAWTYSLRCRVAWQPLLLYRIHWLYSMVSRNRIGRKVEHPKLPRSWLELSLCIWKRTHRPVHGM